MRVILSRAERRQFIGGSDESPVSMAKICGVNSSKHSSRESKPDAAPKTEKWGVQAWARTNTASGDESMTIFKSSFASIPSIGLPSALRFPIFDNAKFIFAASAKSCTKIIACIFRVFSFLL